MKKPLDILAFSPHPDDAEFGCGGSLLIAHDRGLRVAVADLSEGECSTRGTPKKREEEKAAAAKLLGLCERFSLRFPDTQIGLNQDHRLHIIELIRATRPSIVLAPYWVDRHPDHENTGHLIRSACFFAGVDGIGKAKPYRPKRVYYYMIHTPFTPSFIIDISNVWKRKLGLLSTYSSQFSNRDSTMQKTAISRPEFLRYHEARSIYFGAMIGARYAEPFFSQGPIPTNGFPGLSDQNPCPNESPQYTPFL